VYVVEHPNVEYNWHIRIYPIFNLYTNFYLFVCLFVIIQVWRDQCYQLCRGETRNVIRTLEALFNCLCFSCVFVSTIIAHVGFGTPGIFKLPNVKNFSWDPWDTPYIWAMRFLPQRIISLRYPWCDVVWTGTRVLTLDQITRRHIIEYRYLIQ